MSRISTFVVGALAGAALIYGALTHHLLRTTSGWETLPKTSATFDDSYVDVRAFELSDWAEHKDLVAAIIKADKNHLLGEAAQSTLEQSAGRLLQQIRQ